MPLDVQLIRAREFVRVGAHGEIDLENSRAILQTLSAACRKRGIERAMLDLRDVWSNFGPEELATCVRLFHEIGSPYIQRLALIHRGDPQRRVRTLALIASLRGWDVRAFGDFESAFEWLALMEGQETERKQRAAQKKIPVKNGAPRNPAKKRQKDLKG